LKALTLHEPWASLVAYRFKEVETRDWYTSHRGPLAIHAGKTKPDPTDVSRLTFHLGHHGFEMPAPHYGAIVCTCNLVACMPTALVQVTSLKLKDPFVPARGWDFETPFGNYAVGRWAWILRDVVRCNPPIYVAGARKLWNWSNPNATP
jgi:hypothetical protein